MSLLLSLSLAASLALGATQHSPLAPGSDPLADPVKEARVMRLGKQFRCAVCQGVSIADSPAAMARSQLDKLRELVAQDKTDQEIHDYFVARYGEWVLLEPPATGMNLLVWLGPMMMFVFGGGLIFWFVQEGKKRPDLPASQADGDAALEAPPPGTDPYLDAVRRELER